MEATEKLFNCIANKDYATARDEFQSSIGSVIKDKVTIQKADIRAAIADFSQSMMEDDE